jgi:predicted DNA-binding transcriptional regulator YafY
LIGGEKKEQVISHIRADGLEVDEKIVFEHRLIKSRDWDRGAQVMVRDDLSKDLAECLEKLSFHTPLSEDQKLHPQEANEGYIFTASVHDTWQLGWWILGQGKDMIIYEPECLRTRTIDTLEAALNGYIQSTS